MKLSSRLRLRRHAITLAAVLFAAFGLRANGHAAPAPVTRYVVYYNSDASPLDALLGTPYTHVILSFVTPSPGAGDPLSLRVSPKLDPFWEVVPKLQAEGKKVLISFGGGEVGANGYTLLAGHEAELADRLGRIVEAHGLDGIDIDFEASVAFDLLRPDGLFDGRQFLVALTRALRTRLPAPRYLLSHSPQPPYLDPEWHEGPYIDVLRQAGDAVDWIAVQYYDNPGFNDPMADRGHPSSYAGLIDNPRGLRWPSNKLVVGKPIYERDAASGHIDPQAVIDTIVRPLRNRWSDAFGGLMGWQFSTETPDHEAWNTTVGEALLGRSTAIGPSQASPESRD